MSSTIEQVRAEEREALARHRQGERLARDAARARAQRERQERNARRRLARREREQLQPALRRARRAYFAALDDAVKDRVRDTVETIDARFDIADRRMDVFQALARRDTRLARAARG